MEATGPPAGRKRGAAPAWAGELIVQNGRQTGARRPLQVPLTFVGRAQGCDLRLNMDGIDPIHCLLVHGPDGLSIRDLDSTTGTFVNGERVSSDTLKDGDLLVVGPFQFRLHLPPTNFAIPDRAAGGAGGGGGDLPPGERDALRLQAAAVAAQQVALGEEEVRLLHRRASLERQEEQLASHIEEKRRKLLLLNERAQNERQALQDDRLVYEKHLEKITGDLSLAQREVAQNKEKFHAKRHRLAAIYRRTRQRLQTQVQSAQHRLEQREEHLAQEQCRLDQENQSLQRGTQELVEKLLHFNAEYETGRQQLKLGWMKLRDAQQRWRQRRRGELAILKQRSRDAAGAGALLDHARQLLLQDQKTWEDCLPALEQELEGLNQRVKNQRHKILEFQLEINRLENVARMRQESPANPENTALVPLPGPIAAAGAASDSADKKLRQSKGKGHKQGRRSDAPPLVVSVENLPAANPTPDPQPWRQFESELQRRLAHLDDLAGDIADQRLLLLEQWQRLVQTQHTWESERVQIIAELEATAQGLHQQELELSRRERHHEQADNQFRQRYRELVHLRQHLVAWRARLKTRETCLEGERQQVLNEARAREDLVEKQLAALIELRQRWSRRRRQEIAQLSAERAACQQDLKESHVLRDELAGKFSQVEEEKRELTEKTLALEQYRHDFFIRINQSAGDRRLERLRRRWLTQNATLVRSTTQDRDALHKELTRIEVRLAELHQRQDAVDKGASELADQQNAFEHKQALVAVRTARLEQELQSSEAQRALVDQQLSRLKEEIERIARQLMEEPAADNPTEKAA